MSIEPCFIGVVPCKGQNIEHAKELELQAESNIILAKFYRLTREDQLLVAAMSEELILNRDESGE